MIALADQPNIYFVQSTKPRQGQFVHFVWFAVSLLFTFRPGAADRVAEFRRP